MLKLFKNNFITDLLLQFRQEMLNLQIEYIVLTRIETRFSIVNYY